MKSSGRTGMQLVLILGFVSLFSDMTYESARSITGPYLALLGASAAVVSIVAGAGELLGYALRYASGRLADSSRRYWTLTLIGYGLNLFAVPLMAVAGRWEIAAVLIFLERIGKAIRNPARDVILSYATQEMGRGWGFGLHRAMDQTGSVIGPLLMSAALAWRGDYALAFAALLLPAILAMLSLSLGPLLFRDPSQLETHVSRPALHGHDRTFWLYLAGAALLAAGYADFPLIAFHLKKTGAFSDVWIPVLYAAAMVSEAFFALCVGRWYDRGGLVSLITVSGLAALFVPLVFWGNGAAVTVGMLLWGMGMGAQNSAMKAVLAEITPPERRGATYGLFHLGYGLSWFIGSATLGLLYDGSLVAVVVFSLSAQWLGLPLLWRVHRRLKPPSLTTT